MMHQLAGVLGVLLATAVACESPDKTRTPPVQAGAANEPASASPVDWEEPIVVARGDGHRGRWVQNDSKFHYVDDPTVAVSGDGTVTVVWVDNRAKDAFLQRYDSAGNALLEEPTNVSRTPNTFSWLPRIAQSPDGERVFVLWQEIIFSGGTHGGEALFARSLDGGATFDTAVNLSNTTAGVGKGRVATDTWDNGSLDIALTDDGTLLAAWTEYQGPLRVARSTDRGESFSDPIHVGGTPKRPARGPAIASTPGAVYLAWTMGRTPEADILLATSDDGGVSFGTPRAIRDTPHRSDAPDIVVDPDGTLHTVWWESEGAPRTPGRIAYTRRRRGEAKFEAPRAISNDELASFPSVTVDETGRLYVLWEHHPTRDALPRGLRLSLSDDAGAEFSASRFVPGTEGGPGFNGSLQGRLTPKLAAGQSGRVAVGDSRFVHKRHSLVRLLRGRVDGE